MTAEQFKGIADRLVAMLLVWLVAKGYLAEGDAATAGTILIGLLSLAYGWWVNRDKALLQSAATVPGTTVVTQSNIAHNTPETNIVSNTTSEVVRK